MAGCRTPRLVPSEAMMNENSPICTNEKLVSIESRIVAPPHQQPKVAKKIMPTMTTMLTCHY